MNAVHSKTKDEVASLLADVTGKRINVSEAGRYFEGRIEEVELTNDDCTIYYELDDGRVLPLGFAYEWGYVSRQGDTLQVSVPMVGSAEILSD